MLTPGPLRSTAARAEEQLAVVTIFSAARLQRRVQPRVARQGPFLWRKGEKMDASEIHARRLDAKEVLSIAHER